MKNIEFSLDSGNFLTADFADESIIDELKKWNLELVVNVSSSSSNFKLVLLACETNELFEFPALSQGFNVVSRPIFDVANCTEGSFLKIEANDSCSGRVQVWTRAESDIINESSKNERLFITESDPVIKVVNITDSVKRIILQLELFNGNVEILTSLCENDPEPEKIALVELPLELSIGEGFIENLRKKPTCDDVIGILEQQQGSNQFLFITFKSTSASGLLGIQIERQELVHFDYLDATYVIPKNGTETVPISIFTEQFPVLFEVFENGVDINLTHCDNQTFGFFGLGKAKIQILQTCENSTKASLEIHSALGSTIRFYHEDAGFPVWLIIVIALFSVLFVLCAFAVGWVVYQKRTGFFKVND